MCYGLNKGDFWGPLKNSGWCSPSWYSTSLLCKTRQNKHHYYFPYEWWTDQDISRTRCIIFWEVSKNFRLMFKTTLTLVNVIVHETISRRRLSNNDMHGGVVKRKLLLPRKNVAAYLQFVKDIWISQNAIGRMFFGWRRPKQNFFTWMKSIIFGENTAFHRTNFTPCVKHDGCCQDNLPFLMHLWILNCTNKFYWKNVRVSVHEWTEAEHGLCSKTMAQNTQVTMSKENRRNLMFWNGHVKVLTLIL